jgi:hypothetical protein
MYVHYKELNEDSNIIDLDINVKLGYYTYDFEYNKKITLVIAFLPH